MGFEKYRSRTFSKFDFPKSMQVAPTMLPRPRETGKRAPARLRTHFAITQQSAAVQEHYPFDARVAIGHGFTDFLVVKCVEEGGLEEGGPERAGIQMGSGNMEKKNLRNILPRCV